MFLFSTHPQLSKISHLGFKSLTLFRKKLAGWTGLEPAASCVTGKRYNQLNYHPVLLNNWRF